MSPATRPPAQSFSTKYGELNGVTSAATYPDGTLRSCMVNRPNRLVTPVGEIVTQYQSAVFGERQKKHRSALDFFPNGDLKSAALDQAAVLDTPIGPVKAELVTFYEDHRGHPLADLRRVLAPPFRHSSRSAEQLDPPPHGATAQGPPGRPQSLRPRPRKEGNALPFAQKTNQDIPVDKSGGTNQDIPVKHLTR